MASKVKRQLARARHRRDKRRARYKRILKKYPTLTGPNGEDRFASLQQELLCLNVKYIQQLVNDLKSGAIVPCYGDYHRTLQRTMEMALMEKTILK